MALVLPMVSPLYRWLNITFGEALVYQILTNSTPVIGYSFGNVPDYYPKDCIPKKSSSSEKAAIRQGYKDLSDNYNIKFLEYPNITSTPKRVSDILTDYALKKINKSVC